MQHPGNQAAGPSQKSREFKGQAASLTGYGSTYQAPPYYNTGFSSGHQVHHNGYPNGHNYHEPHGHMPQSLPNVGPQSLVNGRPCPTTFVATPHHQPHSGQPAYTLGNGAQVPIQVHHQGPNVQPFQNSQQQHAQFPLQNVGGPPGYMSGLQPPHGFPNSPLVQTSLQAQGHAQTHYHTQVPAHAQLQGQAQGMQPLHSYPNLDLTRAQRPVQAHAHAHVHAQVENRSEGWAYDQTVYQTERQEQASIQQTPAQTDLALYGAVRHALTRESQAQQSPVHPSLCRLLREVLSQQTPAHIRPEIYAAAQRGLIEYDLLPRSEVQHGPVQQNSVPHVPAQHDPARRILPGQDPVQSPIPPAPAQQDPSQHAPQQNAAQSPSEDDETHSRSPSGSPYQEDGPQAQTSVPLLADHRQDESQRHINAPPPDDLTALHPGQADWNVNDLPDILYVLKPASWHRMSERLIKDCKEPVFGKILKDFIVLPKRISSWVEGWRLEAWMRLDRRIKPSDIIDRVNPKYSSALTVKKLAARRQCFRRQFHLASWESEEEIEAISDDLQAIGIDPAANSTRGLTPGLINPQRGEEGGRIPLPKMNSFADNLQSVERAPQQYPRLVPNRGNLISGTPEGAKRTPAKGTSRKKKATDTVESSSARNSKKAKLAETDIAQHPQDDSELASHEAGPSRDLAE